MTVIREFDNGWMLAMNDEVGKRVIPGSVFRFGAHFDGHPVIEFYQRGSTEGMRSFLPGETEASVRSFLVSVGFVEARRFMPGDLANVSLKHIADIIAPPAGSRSA